jgi:hypothetical protein
MHVCQYSYSAAEVASLWVHTVIGLADVGTPFEESGWDSRRYGRDSQLLDRRNPLFFCQAYSKLLYLQDFKASKDRNLHHIQD